MLACEHDFGVWAGAGFQEEGFWGAVREVGGYLCGGGETAAAVGGGGGLGWGEVKGLEDGGVELHLSHLRSVVTYNSLTSKSQKRQGWEDRIKIHMRLLTS